MTTTNETMNDRYGDSIDHTACNECGLCKACGDCKKYGCGQRASTQPTDRTAKHGLTVDRAAFEKHYASMHAGFVPRFYDGEYDWADAQPCWLTWQAAIIHARNK